MSKALHELDRGLMKHEALLTITLNQASPYMRAVGFAGSAWEQIGPIAAAFMLIFMIAGSWLADLIGRRAVLLIAAIVLSFAIPYFHFVNTGSFLLAAVGEVIGFGFVFGFGHGAIPAFHAAAPYAADATVFQQGEIRTLDRAVGPRTPGKADLVAVDRSGPGADVRSGIAGSCVDDAPPRSVRLTVYFCTAMTGMLSLCAQHRVA
jgi:hypothetical protein